MDLQEMMAEIRSLQAEQKTANETRAAEINAQIDGLKSEIAEINKRQANMERPNGSSHVAKDTRHSEAVFDYMRTGQIPETRAYLDGSTDGDGGVLLHDDVVKQIIVKSTDEDEISEHCKVQTTSQRNVTATSLEGVKAGWGTVSISENELQTGQKDIAVQKMMVILPIDIDTLEDEDHNLEETLISEVSRKMAEARANGFATGRGAAFKEPNGFAVDAEVLANAVESEETTGVGSTYQKALKNFNKVWYALPKPYRKRAKVAMNSNTELEYASLMSSKDTSAITYRADGKAYLFNRVEIFNNEALPDPVAGECPLFLGDFSSYNIRVRKKMSIQRQTDSKYAEAGRVGFLFTYRAGGRVLQPEAIVPMQIKAA